MKRLNGLLHQGVKGLAQTWQRFESQALRESHSIGQRPIQHGHQLAFRHEGAVKVGALPLRVAEPAARCDVPPQMSLAVPTQGLIVTHLDGCDKAIAAAAERFDEALLPSTVPNGLGRLSHADARWHR